MLENEANREFLSENQKSASNDAGTAIRNSTHSPTAAAAAAAAAAATSTAAAAAALPNLRSLNQALYAKLRANRLALSRSLLGLLPIAPASESDFRVLNVLLANNTALYEGKLSSPCGIAPRVSFLFYYFFFPQNYRLE